MVKNFALPLHTQNHGAIAQLVEQRTENPCVPGSIPGGTTVQNANNLKIKLLAFFFFLFCPTFVQQWAQRKILRDFIFMHIILLV